MAIDQHKELLILLERTKEGPVSPGEYKRLIEIINADHNGEVVEAISLFFDKVETGSINNIEPYNRTYWQQVLSEIKKQPFTGFTIADKPISTAYRIHFLKTTWLRYAAAIILILGAATYLWFNNSAPNPVHQKNPLNPSSDNYSHNHNHNKATLTLADGNKIILDEAQDGNLAQQGNTKIIKLNAGQLAYHQNTVSEDAKGYNTISTPRGGQYQITLPDGTKVWLNASSSIKFPVAFSTTERLVETTGELYLEIAPNKTKPFFLKTNGTTIQVLGTSFNINSYSNEEATKTTLLQGSIAVNKGIETALLKPGEQAIINNSENSKIQKIQIQTNDVIAWKNGAFNFNDADLPTLLRQLERWYDIDVQYEGTVPQKKFKGDMDRNVSLSYVLEFLNKMGIKFKMEGRTLTIKGT